MLTASSHCSIVEGVEVQLHIDKLDHSQKFRVGTAQLPSVVLLLFFTLNEHLLCILIDIQIGLSTLRTAVHLHTKLTSTALL